MTASTRFTRQNSDAEADLAMSLNPLSVAFVSGKGGVGKTTLAANFAWVCSKVAKTVLVDLDFQNQGCTGLFAPLMQFASGNALAAIQSSEAVGPQELKEFVSNLNFLPAVSWKESTSQEEIVRSAQAPDFQLKLAALIERLNREQGFAIIILDCHGGVDAVSLAAFQSCTYTLMVTEADSVTFAGTLELLSYYEAKTGGKRTVAAGNSDTGKTAGPNSTAENEGLTPPSPPLLCRDDVPSAACIKLIVNRLPSKYRYKDLEQIFGRYLQKKLGIFTPEKSVFCYIPAEELLADSFGDYPFHAKLAPTSIFSKKIHYMVHSMLSGHFEIPLDYKPLQKFQKERYRRRIERKVFSNEFKNTNSILKFYAWFSTFIALALVVFFAYAMVSLRWNVSILSLFTERTYVVFAAAGITIWILMLWYSLKAQFGLMFLSRSKHKYQKALFRALSPRLSFWQRLTLARLLVLRIGTSIIPAFLIFYLLTFFVYFVLIVVELARD